MNKLTLAIAAGALLLSGTAHATLVGAPVTGSLTFGGATNFFDPANAFVPAGFGNTAGTTVTIGSGTEFGFDDTANADAADFTDTQLIVTDTLALGLTGPWTMTFTSNAFGSITLNTSSFDPSLTYNLLANTITLHYAGTSAPPPGTSYRAVFDIGPAAAVPEPASWAMMLLGFVGVAAAVRRKRSVSAAA